MIQRGDEMGEPRPIAEIMEAHADDHERLHCRATPPDKATEWRQLRITGP